MEVGGVYEEIMSDSKFSMKRFVKKMGMTCEGECTLS